MPLFEQQFFEYLKRSPLNTMGYPLVLGGVSNSGGGGGGPAGGFVGMLPQTKITFDWLEDDTTDTIPTLSASLYDNLNRIRYRIKSLETTISGGGGGHVIEEEGAPVTQRVKLNFVGDGVFVTDDGVDTTVVTISGGGGGHTIQYSGISETQRTNLNFFGNGVTVTDNAGDDATDIYITTPSGTGGGHIIQYSGVPEPQRTILNFYGDGVTIFDNAGSDATEVFIAALSGPEGPQGPPGVGGHTIQDNGTPETQRTNLNFTGTGVTVTDDGGNDATVIDITFSGGGGGHVIQYSGVPLTQRANLNFAGKLATVTDDAPNDSTVLVFEDYTWIDINRCGFINHTDTTLSFNPADYTVTLAGTTWSYFRAGIEYIISGNKTCVLAGGPPPPKGSYFIYIDDTLGTLSQMNSSWSLGDSKIPVAIVEWDNALTPKYHLIDERHTVAIDRMMHAYLHQNFGVRFTSGNAPDEYTILSAVDDDITYRIPQAEIDDEDLEWTLAQLDDGDGATANYTCFYRNGASAYDWVRSIMPYIYTGGGYIQYDLSGTMTEGQNNKWYNYYLLYTNMQGDGRFITLPGRAEFSSAAAAYAEDPRTFSFTGFPIPEAVIMYQFTYHTSSSFGSKGKAEITRTAQRITASVSSVTVATSTLPGHIIKDGADTAYPQRGSLEFADGFIVTDELAENETIVTLSGVGSYVFGDASVTPGNLAIFNGDGYHIEDGGPIPSVSGGSAHVIQDTGTPLTQRANLNFIGALVEDDAGNDATKVTFSGGTGSGTIDGAGVLNRIAIWSGASTLTESEHLQIDTVGDIIRLGDQIRPSLFGTGMRIVGSDQTQDKSAYFSLRSYDDSAACDNEFGMWRSRGTSAVPAALEDDDCIGRVIFLGQHDTGAYDYAMGIAIAGYAAENLSPTNRGSELKIFVTTAGQASQMDKEYLFRDGDLDVPDNFRSDGLFGRRSTNGKDVTMTAGYSWVVAGDYTIDVGTILTLEADAIMEII